MKKLLYTLIFLSVALVLTAQSSPLGESVEKGVASKYIVPHPVLIKRLTSFSNPQQDELACAFNNYALQYDSLWTAKCKARNLPSEFRLLPFALTKMDVNYKKRQATGVWALSPIVASRYGLLIDEQYDERKNIALATEAALNYLHDLYHSTNESFWKTVLSYSNNPIEVYNANIDEDLNRWTIWNWYTKRRMQQVEIIPELMTYICVADLWPLSTQLKAVHLVEIEDTIDLDLFCSTIELSKEQFLLENPALSATSTFLRPHYKLMLSTNAEVLYLAQKDSLVQKSEAMCVALSTSLETSKETEEPKAIVKEIAPQHITIYKVKSGDTLGHIAKRNKVSITQLKRWNNLKSDVLQIGQRIKIIRN